MALAVRTLFLTVSFLRSAGRICLLSVLRLSRCKFSSAVQSSSFQSPAPFSGDVEVIVNSTTLLLSRVMNRSRQSASPFCHVCIVTTSSTPTVPCSFWRSTQSKSLHPSIAIRGVVSKSLVWELAEIRYYAPQQCRSRCALRIPGSAWSARHSPVCVRLSKSRSGLRFVCSPLACSSLSASWVHMINLRDGLGLSCEPPGAQWFVGMSEVSLLGAPFRVWGSVLA